MKDINKFIERVLEVENNKGYIRHIKICPLCKNKVQRSDIYACGNCWSEVFSYFMIIRKNSDLSIKEIKKKIMIQKLRNI